MDNKPYPTNGARTRCAAALKYSLNVKLKSLTLSEWHISIVQIFIVSCANSLERAKKFNSWSEVVTKLL